jgi:DNA-binding transcriptional regulator GbsR (MarR family)
MSSPAITTVLKMMESLPEDVQDRVAEHLREYIQDLQDELKWDKSFKKTQAKLVTAAQRAKQEINEGLAEPMDYNQL